MFFFLIFGRLQLMNASHRCLFSRLVVLVVVLPYSLIYFFWCHVPFIPKNFSRLRVHTLSLSPTLLKILYPPMYTACCISKCKTSEKNIYEIMTISFIFSLFSFLSIQYRVFIKYCVFSKAFLCFPSVLVCVHRPGRQNINAAAELVEFRKITKTEGKNTIFYEHPGFCTFALQNGENRDQRNVYGN